MKIESVKNRVEAMKPMLTEFMNVLDNLNDVNVIFKAFSDLHLQHREFEGKDPKSKEERSFIGFIFMGFLTEEELLEINSDIKFTVIKSFLEKFQLSGIDTSKLKFNGRNTDFAFSPSFVIEYDEIPLFWFELQQMKEFYNGLKMNVDDTNCSSEFLYEKYKRQYLESIKIAEKSIETHQNKIDYLLQEKKAVSFDEAKEKRMIQHERREIKKHEQRVNTFALKLDKMNSVELECLKIISLIKEFIVERFENN